MNFDVRCKTANEIDLAKLESLVRRVSVIMYYATFRADLSKVDMQNKVFPDQPESKNLSTQPYGPYCYLHDHLVSLQQSRTLQGVRDLLAIPSDTQRKPLNGFVLDAIGALDA